MERTSKISMLTVKSGSHYRHKYIRLSASRESRSSSLISILGYLVWYEFALSKLRHSSSVEDILRP